MDKNQLVYSLQSARWRSVAGQKPPLLAPWEKGLSEALACLGTLDADDLEAAVRAAFEKYLQFDGTPHKKITVPPSFQRPLGAAAHQAPAGRDRPHRRADRRPLCGRRRELDGARPTRCAPSFARTSAKRRITTTSSAASAAASIPRRRSRASSSAAAPAITSAAISGSPAASACRASPCAPTRSVFSSRPPSRPSATAPPTSATAHCIRTLSCA